MKFKVGQIVKVKKDIKNVEGRLGETVVNLDVQNSIGKQFEIVKVFDTELNTFLFGQPLYELKGVDNISFVEEWLEPVEEEKKDNIGKRTLINALEKENRDVQYKLHMLNDKLFQMRTTDKIEHHLIYEQIIALQNYKKYLECRIELYRMKEGKDAN